MVMGYGPVGVGGVMKCQFEKFSFVLYIIHKLTLFVLFLLVQFSSLFCLPACNNAAWSGDCWMECLQFNDLAGAGAGGIVGKIWKYKCRS